LIAFRQFGCTDFPANGAPIGDWFSHVQVAGLTVGRKQSLAIDIDKLTEAELIDLNNRIVARLKFLHQMRLHASMLEFSLGERVSFKPDGHPVLIGVITKYNRKSVTVITETGQHWTVAPVFLRKLKPVPEADTEDVRVIRLSNNQE